MDFINQQTTQTAKALLGVKIIYQDDYQTYTGYIVETEAYLGIIDGSTLNDCKLSIDTNHRKYPKTIVESGRIGIPNKGEWTNKPLRFTVKGNPYVSRMRKSDFQNPDDTWK
ncbi:3-methyladenine DNA glycosylase Mpg [Staphylococcus epidermidis]